MGGNEIYFLTEIFSLNSFPGALKRKENIKLKIKLGSEGWGGGGHANTRQ